MQTNALSRNWKLACLVLLSPALVTVCKAQVVAYGVSDAHPTLWLQPSGIDSGTSTTPGDPVSHWTDSAATPSIVLNAGGSTGPVLGSALGPSNLKTVSFGGQGYLLNGSINGSSLISDTASTVFMVESTSFSVADQTSFSWVGPNNNTDHTVLATRANAGSIIFNQGANGDQISGTGPSSAFHVLTFQRGTGSDATAGLIRSDGTDLLRATGLFPSTAPSANVVGTLTVGALSIDQTGSGVVQNQLFNGTIAEILVYNSALGGGDIGTIESALGSKYGLSVVPEPSQYATVFGLICVAGAVAMRLRRQRAAAAQL